ncbi:hypothetical protein CEP53_009608 [Fusarium sp. AF-6]|nr:hypothetical protein CEP53_009608 [Fusarium sp. AF-6]
MYDVGPRFTSLSFFLFLFFLTLLLPHSNTRNKVVCHNPPRAHLSFVILFLLLSFKAGPFVYCNQFL